nr:hypothetical protein [uncultured Cohaesibacter sp.]
MANSSAYRSISPKRERTKGTGAFGGEHAEILGNESAPKSWKKQ